MADSDSSSLSSAPSTDDEAMLAKMTKPTGLDRYFKPAPKPQKEPTPEPPKRVPSPPHEYTLADNDAIAFLVMFRSRFSDAFPKSLPHYGPQDIERGVSGSLPDEHAERLLCALLSLALNRKKDVERGHYGRALEDAISSNQSQWPSAWNGTNPLHGGKNFNNMTPEERLTLLRTLVLWSLNSSEIVQAILKESYKQTRRDDDKNQPRSVQPWFSDAYRRKYWLVEGLEDSYFRVYRENDGRTAKTNMWFSVAGTIDDINVLADKFMEEATTNSKINAEKLKSAIPRFEAGEEKRKRREYRIARKAAFTRPEPGFSLYEGRTRGKRMKYTFSDEEDGSDSYSRRSGVSTPLELGPTVTASGRQVKSRLGGIYGESILTDQRKELERIAGEEDGVESDDMPNTAPSGRPMRGARTSNIAQKKREQYMDDGMGSDSEEAQSSGNDWSGNEDEPDASEPDFDAEDEDDEDEEMSDEGLEPDDLDIDENTQESLVVQLRYRKTKTPLGNTDVASTTAAVADGGLVNGTGYHSGVGDQETKMEGFSGIQDQASKPQSVEMDGAEPQPMKETQPTGPAPMNPVQQLSTGIGMQNGLPPHSPPQLQAMDVS